MYTDVIYNSVSSLQPMQEFPILLALLLSALIVFIICIVEWVLLKIFK